MGPALPIPADCSPPYPPPRRLAGGLSIALAAVSLALTAIGYAIVRPYGASCPLTEVWRGTVFAVASAGTAAPGLACGLAGTVLPRANRRLAWAGVGLHAGFVVLFYRLWL